MQKPRSTTNAPEGNPRFPLISELKQLLLDSYYGRAYTEAYLREVKTNEATDKKVA